MKTERNNLFTYNDLSARQIKSLEILELLRKKGSISRTEISKISGINMGSVSNYLKKYIDRGLILTKGLDVSTGGRKPELVELGVKDGCVIGLDVSRDGVKAVLTDLAASVMERVDIKNTLEAKDAAAKCMEIIENLLNKSGNGPDKIKAIGVGVPDDSFISIASLIEQKLKMETFAGGRVSCAALGERNINKGADKENMLYIYSDVGRGIFITPNLCIGASGVNGELKNSYSKASNENSDLSEKAKYLRPWDPATGIIIRVMKEIARGVGTKIVGLAGGNIANIKEEMVIEAARDNDELASDIIQSIGINLGIRVAYLINLFKPDTVVVGGGIENAGELILRPITKTINKLAFKKYAALVKIIPGILGDDAVSRGAASFAVRELFLRT